MKSESPSGYHVLLVGRYFCDLVFTNLPEFPRLGHEIYSKEFHLVPGGVFTPAVTLTRLGLRTVWPCEFGSDPFSQFVKDQALNAGMDGSFFSQSPIPSLRITVAFSFNQERAFLSYADSPPDIPYAEIIRETRPKWVYITHLMIGKQQRVIVKAASDVSSRVLMDCQAHTTQIQDPSVRDAIAAVDVFSPNRQEALCLTGEKDIHAALDSLSKITRTVIIKNGKDGCLCAESAVVVHIPAIKMKVVDTTGAGDNFNCGFIFGQLQDYSLEDSLRIGNICGGLSTTRVGGSGFTINENIISAYLKKRGS